MGVLPSCGLRNSSTSFCRAWGKNSSQQFPIPGLLPSSLEGSGQTQVTYPDVPLHLPDHGHLSVAMCNVLVDRDVMHPGSSNKVGQVGRGICKGVRYRKPAYPRLKPRPFPSLKLQRVMGGRGGGESALRQTRSAVPGYRGLLNPIGENYF